MIKFNRVAYDPHQISRSWGPGYEDGKPDSRYSSIYGRISMSRTFHYMGLKGAELLLQPIPAYLTGQSLNAG